MTTKETTDLKSTMRKLSKMAPDSRTRAQETVIAMLNNAGAMDKARERRWRLMAATPKDGPLWRILGAFERETDIPLEVPFFCVIHLVSGWLLSKGVRLTGAIGEIGPELWTIVLAESGSGKTLAHKVLAEAAPVQSTFPECSSGYAFIESFQTFNNTIYYQDEFAQTLKEIENKNGPMAEVRKYMLRVYDNEKIERKTKDGTITIDKPRIGILGLNTPESFLNAMSLESLMDGFAQRFALVQAPADKKRPMEENAIYNIPALQTAAREAMQALTALEIHDRYHIGESALEAFKQAFRMMFTENVPKSFYRRIMFRGFKYALFYHVLLGKTTSEIDAEDMGWGATLSAIHMEDMIELLKKKKELCGVVQTARKVLAVSERFAAQGKTLTPRDLVSGVRDIHDAGTARAFLDLLPPAALQTPTTTPATAQTAFPTQATTTQATPAPLDSTTFDEGGFVLAQEAMAILESADPWADISAGGSGALWNACGSEVDARLKTKRTHWVPVFCD